MTGLLALPALDVTLALLDNWLGVEDMPAHSEGRVH